MVGFRRGCRVSVWQAGFLGGWADLGRRGGSGVQNWETQASVGKEKCESGRIGLTANELTWETGSEGSNPSFSASGNRAGAHPAVR